MNRTSCRVTNEEWANSWYGVRPRTEPCFNALTQVCGIEFPDYETDCQTESPEAAVSCVTSPEVAFLSDPMPTDIAFNCECRVEGQADQMTVRATSCGHAMDTARSQALASVTRLNDQIGDYGQICSGPEDCSQGACYVAAGENRGDAICSGPCQTDADCPDYALCAVGYCFVACTDDLQCELLNHAFGNHLACIPRDVMSMLEEEYVDEPFIDEDVKICIQSSEP